MDTAVFNFHSPLKQDEFFPNRIPDDESAVGSLSPTLRSIINVLPRLILLCLFLFVSLSLCKSYINLKFGFST